MFLEMTFTRTCSCFEADAECEERVDDVVTEGACKKYLKKKTETQQFNP